MFGIPPLLNDLNLATATILTVDTAIRSLFKQPKIYGIYDVKTNLPIIIWDSCLSFEYRNESSITEAPQEEGAFISYNKVSSPFIIRTRGTRSSIKGRAELLAECEKLLDSLTLYKFVTPDRVYNNVNLTMINYNRSAENGYSLLSVDFVLKEIRLNLDSRYEQAPKEPAGAKQESKGQVVAK